MTSHRITDFLLYFCTTTTIICVIFILAVFIYLCVNNTLFSQNKKNCKFLISKINPVYFVYFSSTKRQQSTGISGSPVTTIPTKRVVAKVTILESPQKVLSSKTRTNKRYATSDEEKIPLNKRND
jgi:hypothetical protein